eukprot:12950238-Alexandrium_andersonii.AAC.1
MCILTSESLLRLLSLLLTSDPCCNTRPLPAVTYTVTRDQPGRSQGGGAQAGEPRMARPASGLNALQVGLGHMSRWRLCKAGLRPFGNDSPPTNQPMSSLWPGATRTDLHTVHPCKAQYTLAASALVPGLTTEILPMYRLAG